MHTIKTVVTHDCLTFGVQAYDLDLSGSRGVIGHVTIGHSVIASSDSFLAKIGLHKLQMTDGRNTTAYATVMERSAKNSNRLTIRQNVDLPDTV